MMLQLPENPGPARDAAILNYIRASNFEAVFTPITSSLNGHTAVFHVFNDALKIEGVRITMSAYLMQTVADLLSCTLLTTKLSDLIFAQRVVTLPPHTQTPDATMVLTSVMVKQSAWIDSQLIGKSGLASTLGKIWAIDNLLAQPKTAGKAINYGWHFDGTFQGQTWVKAVTTSARVVQNPGWAHAPQEVDYSQNCILVSRACNVDGVERDILDVFADPVLAGLANADGVLHVTRQPGVPVVPPLSSPPTPTSSGPGLQAAAIGLVGLGLGIAGGLKLSKPQRF